MDFRVASGDLKAQAILHRAGEAERVKGRPRTANESSQIQKRFCKPVGLSLVSGWTWRTRGREDGKVERAQKER